METIQQYVAALIVLFLYGAGFAALVWGSGAAWQKLKSAMSMRKSKWLVKGIK